MTGRIKHFNYGPKGEVNGFRLTNGTIAMIPPASVSGLYFSHPEARYFAVDLVTKDQVESYARRKRRPLSGGEPTRRGREGRSAAASYWRMVCRNPIPGRKLADAIGFALEV